MKYNAGELFCVCKDTFVWGYMAGEPPGDRDPLLIASRRPFARLEAGDVVFSIDSRESEKPGCPPEMIAMTRFGIGWMSYEFFERISW